MKADFSGYATRNNIKCSDGRTILPNSFKHQDGMKVPLVWQHQHNNPENILGHALLENRRDGVYAYAYFNDTPNADRAKSLIEHGDISALSIYANKLVQKNSNVLHGDIKEVSLVLSGANPGAFIETISLQHDDDGNELLDVVIYNDEGSLAHEEQPVEEAKTPTSEGETDMAEQDKTVKDVFDGFTEEQKNVVYYLIGEALAAEGAEGAEPSEEEDAEDTLTQSDIIYHQGIQEGLAMSRNVFDSEHESEGRNTLSHAQIQTIIEDGQRPGMTLKDSVLAHAAEYGINNIDILFPDAKNLTNSPEFYSRRTEWVNKVLQGTKHAPFARIKTAFADITAEEARAKGYIKGKLKKDEVIQLLKRTTVPTTIYKKQRLDRDDIIDITDFDVVAWLKAEIRLMLDEELARAILVGDGRLASSTDKVKDPAGATDGIGIRSIVNDDDFYAHKVTIPANSNAKATVEAVARSRAEYRGTGSPTWYTTDSNLTDLLLQEDKMGRRLYETQEALASVLRVSEIVTVEVLEEYPDILGILVNLSDYTVGTDKGGEVNFFDDFDIDFNQNKYLLETRVSGALTKPKSAVVVRRQSGTPVTPTAPSFNGATNTISIPSTSGVVYLINSEPATGSVTITEDTEVVATPASGYYFPSNIVTSWSFTYTEG